MPAWVYGLIALLITTILGWVKWAKLNSFVKELGEALSALGDFVKTVSEKYEDKKIEPEEAEEIVQKARELWKEFQDVLDIFKSD